MDAIPIFSYSKSFFLLIFSLPGKEMRDGDKKKLTIKSTNSVIPVH